jgi:DNA repair exonuclease SbcCD nuclease subunit
MPKFLHTADLHLNAQRRAFPQTYLQRTDWLLAAIEQTAIDHEVDCVVVAGDVFDRADLTNAERYRFAEWLGQLQIPVLCIAGNHDARSQQIGDTCLRDLSALRLKRHLIHDGDPRLVHAFDCSWILFPHHGWGSRELDLIVTSAVETATTRYPDDPIVVVLHEAVMGSSTDGGHQLTQGVQLNGDVPVTYWALGDIHLTQRILPNAFYCGSPYQVDFGEAADKGVLIVDTDHAMEPEFVSLTCPYPLVTLDQRQTEWPEFSRYVGEDDVTTPPHVLRVATTVQDTTPSTSPSQPTVPPLWGLEEHLSKQALDDVLIPRTLELANQMLDNYLTKGV